MKWSDVKDGGKLYSKWYTIVLLVSVVSLMIGYLFSIAVETEMSLVETIFHSLLSTAIMWTACMSVVIYAWRKFPWEHMPIKHLVFEVVMISLVLVVYLGTMILHDSIRHNNTMIVQSSQYASSLIISILITFLITSIHEAIFFYRQWKLNFSKSISLEKDNLEARYTALKAQINPHFLFNSMNSLMNLLDNNPKAEQYIQELSEFLRYVLISNDREAVCLHEEMENLKKYIFLQKMRFGDNLIVNIDVKESVLQYQIPPLSLQMLFDNCIKHNTITTQNPLTINIFNSGNNISIVNNLQRKHTTESTGQGLKNIEGRFRFISGKAIKIVNTESIFSVTVPLIINQADEK